MPSDETRWIVEPPAPGEVNIQIAVHSQARLTPELRRALEQLVVALQTDEVERYAAPCPDQEIVCKPMDDRVTKITSPWANSVTCRIGK